MYNRECTKMERFQRLEADAQRHNLRRANENEEERSHRLEANAQRKLRAKQLNRCIALITKGQKINVQIHTLGQMNFKCQFCKSLSFEYENPRDENSHMCQKRKAIIRTYKL